MTISGAEAAAYATNLAHDQRDRIFGADGSIDEDEIALRLGREMLGAAKKARK